MTSPEEIIKIADTRLKETRSLLNDGHYSGAFYLAGYTVELHLKAKICQNFGICDLFADNSSVEGISELRKVAKTHNFVILLILAGLKPKYEEFVNKTNNQKILSDISILMKEWNERERYKSDDPLRHNNIKKMFNSLDDFLKWIQEN